ncbi:MAG: divergent polysaccharide deacetylase family protein [Sulfuricurvum sp.]
MGLIGYFIALNQMQAKLDNETKINQLLREKIKKIVIVDTKKTVVEAHHEYAPADKQAMPPKAEPRALMPIKPSNAKLVIIMDDVSYAHDVKAIRSVGLPLVMSFLPPSSRHPESATLASSVSGCMVHLPLEAVDFLDEEAVTLRVTDSKEMIAAWIAKIKKLYPAVCYINNHTGSKFTADEAAVDRLIGVMRDSGLTFVDSRTTGETKVKAVDEKYGLRYLGRDVFLDHHDGVENIKKQICEAVDMAKRHGSAIAIGHPRPDTIEALKQSKAILSEVQLVGIDKI